MAEEETKARDRKFRALFDGDEIDGKRYAEGDGITGLDAPTAAFLMQTGRIAEVSDEQFEKLDTQVEFDEDLIDPDKAEDADDRLIAKSALKEIADREEVEYADRDNKDTIAKAIMAKRAE